MTGSGGAWPTGFPCWADVDVPDIPAACDYYGAMFGWTFREMGQEFNGYRVADLDGADAAGIGQLDHGEHSVWTLYFAAADADASAQAIERNGGTLLLPPMDVPPLGRVAIALDPTGATFGLWQPFSHNGAARTKAPGGLAWVDLRSPDPDAARSFYTGVFGFDHNDVERAPPGYRSFSLPGQSGPLGGIGGMADSGDGVPAHWLPFFGVGDAAQACATTELFGGTVTAPAFRTPYGRMAALVDPQGAGFWVTEMTGD